MVAVSSISLFSLMISRYCSVLVGSLVLFLCLFVFSLSLEVCGFIDRTLTCASWVTTVHKFDLLYFCSV